MMKPKKSFKNKGKVAKKDQPLPKQLKSLSYSHLRNFCSEDSFSFKSTAKIPPLKEVIGQDRAVHALTFGLDIKNHGYNIYALGSLGTGKTTIIRKYLEKDAKSKPVPNDWLYVNNFDDNDKPKKLSLPAGKGREFRDGMDQLVLELKTEVPKAFESESYQNERENIEKEFRTKSEELFTSLAKKADEKGFQLVQTAHGFAVLPLVNEKVLTPKEHVELNDAKKQELEKNEEELINNVHESMRQLEHLQKDAKKKLFTLDQRVVSFSVNHLIDALKNKFHSFKDVANYLTLVRTHLLKNVQAFKKIKQAEGGYLPEKLLMLTGAETSFDEYRVNLIVDNSKQKGAPVIYEKNPIAPNLIGRIEQQGIFGALVTNFLMIKGGALHRANGGYLILDILDLLKKPYAWETLKRALKNRELIIENMLENLGVFTTRTLEPEPIPLQTKVVLIGNPLLYYLIHEFDPEFQELFKVKAEFAAYMVRDEKSIHQYAQFVGMVCSEEQLNHFSPGGMAKIIEYGSRLVEHQNKLSTKFGEIVDVIRQANYWAKIAGHKLITAEDVEKTLDEKIYRSSYLEEVVREMIAEKAIKISTEGDSVGQINGLSVLTLGDYSFGKPSRITARTYLGTKGIINIEREIALGGRIHNKATLIIAGYIGGKYAQEVPVAFSGSITFEQIYEEVEGDSASAAEIYVLLSSLAQIPLRQDLAITGSVNQHGEIQAIGGVNEKIEGFFQVCKIFGLTGKQGVIIPESNKQHLMLRQEIIDAVKANKFHIYPITHIDDGIKLLTGIKAGTQKADGSYEKGTFNFLVQDKINEYAKKLKKLSAHEPSHESAKSKKEKK